MTSLFRLSLAALICCFCLMIGCKESVHTETSGSTDVSSTAASSETGPAVPAAAAPESPSAAQTAEVASSVTKGDMHDDLSPLGIPLYPNVFESGFMDTAALALGTLAGVKVEHPGIRQGEMNSHDSFDAVYAWYHQKMPAGSEAAELAASNHTDENGNRMALFEAGTTADPTYQRVMLMGKAGDPTLIYLVGHVTR